METRDSDMRVLAIIPARGGSKGIPRKNLRHAGSRTLVGWAIHAAKEAKLVDRTIVSTDDDAIAAEAIRCGAEVDRRPAHLATDEALTAPVLVELAQRVTPKPELVVLLQPTVPVRRLGLVDECIRRLADSGADSVLTAYPLHFVWWQEEADPDHTDKHGTWRSQCPRRPRRQDMRYREQMFHEDGAVFVVRLEKLIEYESHVTEWKRFRDKHPDLAGSTPPLRGHVEIVETDWSPDIDTWDQLLAADAIMRARQADPRWPSLRENGAS